MDYLSNKLHVFNSLHLFLLQLAKCLSDVGGILGIWIGCSVISVAEVFLLLVDLVLIMVGKPRDAQETRQPEQEVRQMAELSPSNGNDLGK